MFKKIVVLDNQNWPAEEQVESDVLGLGLLDRIAKE
jgi:hypothetical protein